MKPTPELPLLRALAQDAIDQLKTVEALLSTVAFVNEEGDTDELLFQIRWVIRQANKFLN